MADLGLAGAAQRTRFRVSSTAVSFHANLLPTVQAHVKAMRIPEDGPAAPQESGTGPAAISFWGVRVPVFWPCLKRREVGL